MGVLSNLNTPLEFKCKTVCLITINIQGDILQIKHQEQIFFSFCYEFLMKFENFKTWASRNLSLAGKLGELFAI